jgi:hypothetical protein
VLAIIGDRARKQRPFLLELAANDGGRLLTFSANMLAIIAACSPMDGRAHIRRQ